MGVLIGLSIACAAAIVLLQRRARAETAGMRVLGKLALEPRRAIYMIEVGGRCFLVGVGDGPMTLLSEVERPPAVKVAA